MIVSTFSLRNSYNIKNALYFQLRCYPRWSHRRPVRIIHNNNVFENSCEFVPREKYEKSKQYYNTNSSANMPNKKVKWRCLQTFKSIHGENNDKESKLKPSKIKGSSEAKCLPSKTIAHKDGDFVYTKVTDKDTKISTIMSSIKSKKSDCILLEGKRLIKEALISGCKPRYLLFSRKTELEFIKPSLPHQGITLYKMPYREMQMWSDLTTSPGIIGIFETPNITNKTWNKETLPITVICDNIREPGNVGSLIRTAAGVGCEKVLLTTGCANVWAPKVTRSASGAHFKLAIEHNIEWSKITSHIPGTVSVFVADNKPEDRGHYILPTYSYKSVNYVSHNRIILIIGGETHGISKEAYEFAQRHNGSCVNVPLVNCVDSLNSATAFGIIAFEIKRQLNMC